MKYEVTHSGKYRSYVDLKLTAWSLLERAKENELGSLLQLKASVVFQAFTFEAYLNHVGSEEIKFWAEIERSPYRKKLNILECQFDSLNVDPSKSPFQRIFELFRLRDKLAHGKTEDFHESYVSNQEPPYNCLLYTSPSPRDRG